MTLFSTVNRKKCIQQERAYHAAIAAEHITKVEGLNAELAAIEAVEGNIGNDEMDQSFDRRRKNARSSIYGINVPEKARRQLEKEYKLEEDR